MKQTVFRWVAVFALILGFCGMISLGNVQAETTDVSSTEPSQATGKATATTESAPTVDKQTVPADVTTSEANVATEQSGDKMDEVVTEATTGQDEAKATEAPKTITSTQHTILHTNDMHGRMIEENNRVIGMAKLKR
ncbi:hypothetical protein [Staphylococcus americanisciuri]|uniref:hypothetical protein n=1 Tax=Staphylococcus americanisciuri TaxID=2973940 RepID=UPI00357115F2